MSGPITRPAAPSRTSAGVDYPVRVSARLDEPLSRWLWLVKWLLAVPHYLVLGVLWAGFVLLTLVAFVAILVTGRYPRGIFEVNLGILRWSWRVAYYSFGALGTDRYPPFTLADVPDYPARLDVAYPAQLSRGLVLVKWWLLAIPHYLIIAAVAGGLGWLIWRPTDGQWDWVGVNLFGALVLVCAVVLAVTGSYPRSLFDLVIGMQRWLLRVTGYAALMTDAYPPFRLDLGGSDPADVATMSPAARPAPSAVPVGHPPAAGWTTPRVLLLVVGALVAMLGTTGLVGGGAVLWADRTNRDSAGYLVSDVERFSTTGSALVSAPVDIDPDIGYLLPDSVVGKVRLRATPTGSSDAVFIGLGPSDQVRRYLDGVDHATIDDIDGDPSYTLHDGAAAGVPTDAVDWVTSAQGTGTQTLDWSPRSGEWTLVVARPDAAPGVSVAMDISATAPVLAPVGAGLMVAGFVVLGLGAAMASAGVYGAVRRRNPEHVPAKEWTR